MAARKMTAQMVEMAGNNPQVSRMRDFMRAYSRGLTIGLGTLTTGGITLYLGRHYLRDQSGKAVTDVLAAEDVVDGARILSKDLVKNVLNDPNSVVAATEFTKQTLLPLLEDEATVQHLVTLLQKTAEQETTKQFFTQLFVSILKMEQVQKEVNGVGSTLIGELTHSEDAKKQVVDLCTRSLASPQLHQAVADMMWGSAKAIVRPAGAAAVAANNQPALVAPGEKPAPAPPPNPKEGPSYPVAVDEGNPATPTPPSPAPTDLPPVASQPAPETAPTPAQEPLAGEPAQPASAEVKLE